MDAGMNISPETEWLPGKSVHNIMRNILTSSIRLRTLQVPDPILQAELAGKRKTLAAHSVEPRV